jgi:tetratricopeptide (TPR) repeat protein
MNRPSSICAGAPVTPRASLGACERKLNHGETRAPRVVLSLCFALLSASGWVWSQAGSRDSLTEAEEAARAGKFDVAAIGYRKLLEAEPQSAELWSNLAAVEAMGGHCERALPAADRARSLNPGLFTPWYLAGSCELRFHHDEKALADLARAVAINSRDANAWYLRAQAAGNLERLGEAFRAVLRGLTLDPARPDGYYQAGKVALDLAAKCYDRVVAAPARSPYRHQLEGDRNTAQGLLDAGIEEYRKALDLTPQDPAVHFALADAYLQSGKLPEAETELRECLKLAGAGVATATQAPRTAWIEERLALVLTRENRAGAARQILASLRLEQFQAPEEFEDFVACAYLLGQGSATGAALTLAIELFPGDIELGRWKTRLAQVPASSPSGASPSPATNSPIRIGLRLRFLVISTPGTGGALAKLFSQPGEYREFRAAFLRNDALASARIVSSKLDRLPAEPAQADMLGGLLQWLAYRFYERLATAYPESEAAQKLAAENLSAAGEQDKALEIYQALLDRNGPSPELLRAIAEIHWTEHKWDDALKVLGSLSKLDPRDPTTLVNLGRIYAYQQDLENARRCFERAAEAGPAMFEAHLGLGETLRRLGNEEGALREFKIASRIEPRNPRPHYALSQVYRKRDNKDLAAQEMAAFERLQAQASLEKTRTNRLLVPLD